jgi:catechol 2,3-dioxygenase-like lactoylglutathione lyase family enzyme
MANTPNRVVIPVKDLDAAKKIYGTWLGTEPHTDAPYYVGFNVGGVEIGLNPNGHATGMTGPTATAEVSDLDATREALLALGATELSAPTPAGPGQRVCVLADADGNPIGIIGA